MGGGIYLRRGADLIAMAERPYPSEDVLQRLVAEHPALLAGEGVDGPGSRWVLLSREAGLPSEEAGGDRWSVDHLFADEEGTPTLVEVKRSSDSRIRREVIGQLVEYAANAVRYWPLEQLRSRFTATCQARGRAPEAELACLLGAGADQEAWWSKVEANLRVGRLRLMFVADRVCGELRRIVEFLNEQMTQTEVLAVEVRQFVDERGEHQTIVPRVIGETEATRDAKARPVRRVWTEDSLMADLRHQRGAEEAMVAERILAWAHERGLSVRLGSGATTASFQIGSREGPARLVPFFLYSSGDVEIQFGLMASVPYPPFDRLESRRELQRRLNALPGVEIADGRLDKRPGFPISALRDQKSLRSFFESMEWAVEQARTAGTS